MTPEQKESIYLLQNIDCNCNDCGYMKRDMDRFKQSLDLHHKWQLDYFNVCKNNLIDKAKSWLKKADKGLITQEEGKKKHDYIMDEVNKMKFVFDKSSCLTNFGTCTKFDKPVSFIPNILQLDTQDCFKHRKDF
jgi:hypothetical protein